MTRRKRAEEEPENHERWLVSYADFITLLFAFFVMMYSISSVNEGKYRVLADSMTTVFKSNNASSNTISTPEVSKTPIQIGKIPKVLAPSSETKPKPKINNIRSNDVPRSRSEMEKDISAGLKKWIKSGDVKLKRSKNWFDVVIGSGVLFRSGSAILSSKAQQILEPLTYQLLTSSRPVYVLGYSDNVPIYTQKFSSNWELSAARAVSVVNLFASLGISPDLLGAIGFGEHRPVADNKTAEGRSQNRRVVVRIFTSDDIFSEKLNDKPLQ